MKVGRGVFSGKKERFAYRDGRYLSLKNNSDLPEVGSIQMENLDELGKPDYLLPPMEMIGQIRDFYAFEEHAVNSRKNRGLEMEPEWYRFPVYYYTSNSSLYGSMENVPYPPFTNELDLEVEVGMVIGKDGKNIEEKDAISHVYGLTLFNDWSARDVWRREARLNLGPSKSKDFATSLGPYITTLDELPGRWNGKSFNIGIKSFINGKLFSDSNLESIYWPLAKMISHASMESTLRKGDILMTGTFPGGCIFERYREGMEWIRKGDSITIESEILGKLENKVV